MRFWCQMASETQNSHHSSCLVQLQYYLSSPFFHVSFIRFFYIQYQLSMRNHSGVYMYVKCFSCICIRNKTIVALRGRAMTCGSWECRSCLLDGVKLSKCNNAGKQRKCKCTRSSMGFFFLMHFDAVRKMLVAAAVLFLTRLDVLRTP